MNKKKVDEIKRILPITWDSYEHMRDVRMGEVNNFRNFLLILISFLPIISLTLLNYFQNEVFFIPIIFQITSLVLVIKTYFIRGPQIPWINAEKGKIFNELDKNVFDVRLFITLKSLENDTFTQLNTFGKWIKYSIYSLLFSVYLVVLGCFFIYFRGIIFYFLSGLLTILTIFIYDFYKKQPKYQFEENWKRYSDEMNEWLSKNAKTKN